MRKHAGLALLALLSLLGTRHSEAAGPTGPIVLDDRTEGPSRRVILRTALPRPDNEVIYNGISFADQMWTMNLMREYRLSAGTTLEVRDNETGVTTACRYNMNGSFSCDAWRTGSAGP